MARRNDQRDDLPAMFTHPKLGRFKHERLMNSYVGSVGISGKKVRLELDCDYGQARDVRDAIEAPARVAAKVLKNPRRLVEDAAEFATRKLMPLKNKHWLADGEKPIDAKEFRRRLKLESIVVSKYGGSVEFDMGEVFGHHGVQVRFGPRGKVRDATI
jgi:hypothetical protein